MVSSWTVSHEIRFRSSQASPKKLTFRMIMGPSRPIHGQAIGFASFLPLG
jgi:hypothetical protein